MDFWVLLFLGSFLGISYLLFKILKLYFKKKDNNEKKQRELYTKLPEKEKPLYTKVFNTIGFLIIISGLLIHFTLKTPPKNLITLLWLIGGGLIFANNLLIKIKCPNCKSDMVNGFGTNETETDGIYMYCDRCKIKKWIGEGSSDMD